MSRLQWCSWDSHSKASQPRSTSRKASPSSTARSNSGGAVSDSVAAVMASEVAIASDVDVVTARQRGRELAAELRFSRGDQTVIAAAISEIARNILTYAGRGTVRMSIQHDGDRSAVVVVARD